MTHLNEIAHREARLLKDRLETLAGICRSPSLQLISPAALAHLRDALSKEANRESLESLLSRVLQECKRRKL